MAPGAGLPAASSLRARPLLPLAPAPEQPPRQHRSGGAQLPELGLQTRLAGLRLAKRTAQPRVLPGQGPERRLLTPRPPQGLAQFRVRTRRRPRARRLARAQQPRLQPFGRNACGSQGDFKTVDLRGQRLDHLRLVAQSPQPPVEPDGLLVQAPDGLFVSRRLLLLPGQSFLQPGDLLLPPADLLALLQGLAHPPRLPRRRHARELLAKPDDLHAQRHERAALARLDSRFRE